MTKIITQDVLKYLVKRDGRSCDVIQKMLDSDTMEDAIERRALSERLTDLYNEMFTVVNLLMAMEDLNVKAIVIEDETIVK